MGGEAEEEPAGGSMMTEEWGRTLAGEAKV
jgi:hypothetical protein